MTISEPSRSSSSHGFPGTARGAAYASGDRSIADGIHPWDIARRVWQRRYLLLGALATGLVLALVVLFAATPKYASQARILLENIDTNFLDRGQARTNPFADAQAVESQIQVLQSERLAEKVIARFHLDQDPEFNKSLGSTGGLLGTIRNLLPHPRLNAAEQAELTRTTVLDEFLKHVTAYQIGTSRVLAVEFSSNDPAKTQLVANALADAYVEDQVQAKLDVNRRGSDWLAGQIATLRQAVENSERKVEAYREKSGLLKGTNSTLYEQNLTDLNTQALAARSNLGALEARLARISKLANSPNGIESVGEVQQSPVVQKLKEQEVALQGRIAEMSVKYLPTNPALVKAKAELDELRRTIRTEVNRVVAGLRNEVEIARHKTEAIDRQLADLKGQAGEANTAEVRLRELEREASADRALLESFMSMHKETVAQDSGGILTADARVISRARLPLAPSFPKPASLFGLAAFVSLLIGVLLVAVLELRDRGFTDLAALEDATGLDILGVVPRVRAGVPCLWQPAGRGYVSAPPEFVEAWRSMQTALLVASETADVQTIILSSAGAREGKTTAALNLSRMLAAGGRRTILIDADMRKPQVHHALGLGDGPGLGDILLGETQFEKARLIDQATGLHVLRAGKRTENPATLLSSKAMDELLVTLRRYYDMVIIDTSPIVEVADAQALFSKTDLTLFIVRWESTRRRAVAQALRLISAGGGRIGGMLLSMADPLRVPHYGYGDYLRAEAVYMAETGMGMETSQKSAASSSRSSWLNRLTPNKGGKTSTRKTAAAIANPLAASVTAHPTTVDAAHALNDNVAPEEDDAGFPPADEPVGLADRLASLTSPVASPVVYQRIEEPAAESDLESDPEPDPEIGAEAELETAGDMTSEPAEPAALSEDEASDDHAALEEVYAALAEQGMPGSTSDDAKPEETPEPTAAAPKAAASTEKTMPKFRWPRWSVGNRAASPEEETATEILKSVNEEAGLASGGDDGSVAESPADRILRRQRHMGSGPLPN